MCSTLTQDVHTALSFFFEGVKFYPRHQSSNTDDFLFLLRKAVSEAEFAQKLQHEGLEMKTVAGDGNCMFRSVADQVYGDEDMHEQVRACCLDYMVRRAFEPIMTILKTVCIDRSRFWPQYRCFRSKKRTFSRSSFRSIFPNTLPRSASLESLAIT